MVIVERHHWRGLGVSGTQRQTARGARAQSDAADAVPRNSLCACACARLTGSYDNLRPMRQRRRGIGKGLQKLDTLGRQIRPVGTPAHRCRCAPAPRSGPAFCAASRKSLRARHGLPAGGQHQLQAGCALRAAQSHHQRGEFGAGADRDALQKLEIADGVHRLDVIRPCGSLLSVGCVARVSQNVAAVDRLNPASLPQCGQHLGSPTAAQALRRDDASIGMAGGRT